MDFLEALLHNGRLVIDTGGEIEAEYRHKLGVGQPGVGNRFLQKFFSEAAHRVVRVSLPTTRSGAYINFRFDGELRRFDQSDRKFVALAAATGHTIFNSTDTYWVEHKDALTARGIKIHFVCGCNPALWFSRQR